MGNQFPRLVSVCIASIGRTSLLETIEGIERCVLPRGIEIEIVVADDSSDGAAGRLVAAIDNDVAKSQVKQVKVIACGAQNISVARNVCIDNACGEYIAFIDDDEIPGREWLACLIHLADCSGADAVQGSVTGVYPVDAPSWANRVRPFDKIYGLAGERIETGSTCNLLVRRSSLCIRSLRFSEAFGKSGGEDTDLCYRLTSSGGIIVCSPASMVYENVPCERLTRQHLVRRYARGGHTYASVILSRQRGMRKALEFCKACALTAGFSTLALVSALVLPAASLRYTLRLSGHVGKLLFFFGLPAWRLY